MKLSSCNVLIFIDNNDQSLEHTSSITVHMGHSQQKPPLLLQPGSSFFSSEHITLTCYLAAGEIRCVSVHRPQRSRGHGRPEAQQQWQQQQQQQRRRRRPDGAMWPPEERRSHVFGEGAPLCPAQRARLLPRGGCPVIRPTESESPLPFTRATQHHTGVYSEKPPS